jgi:glycosyltransferase involved in cell wall biosynthesis
METGPEMPDPKGSIVAAAIWIDVEDVAVHLHRGARPTGIQRLAFEAARAMVQREGAERIRFLRHAPGGDGFYEVPFAVLEAAYESAVSASSAGAVSVGDGAQGRGGDPSTLVPAGLRRAWHRLGDRMPGEVRTALVDVLVPLWASARALGRLPRAAWTARWRAPRRGDGGRSLAGAEMAAGDVLLGLAAPWGSQHMARALAARERHGLRYAMLIYDLIPVMRPEFSVAALTRRYREWARAMMPVCDVPMAISQATRRDVERFAAREGFALRAPVAVVPVGTGFPAGPPHGAMQPAVPGEPFVLCVSTIEVRKNHLLLFRVWRRLVEEMPQGMVPKLVLAGGIGWLVDDLMQQMRNSGFLDGRIEVVDSPTDAMLAALYRGAMFTVYPSHYEGWGLPVAESHGFGTPVVCADATSLPEAGGSLARYFEADSVGDATRVIRALIEDPAGLAAWRAEVRARFRPVAWHETAAAILAAIDAPPDAGATTGAARDDAHAPAHVHDHANATGDVPTPWPMR